MTDATTNNNTQTRMACPTGMKLPKAVKAMAAQLPGCLSNTERKHFMRVVGIAMAESTKVSKSARRDKSQYGVAMPTKSTHTPSGVAL